MIVTLCGSIQYMDTIFTVSRTLSLHDCMVFTPVPFIQDVTSSQLVTLQSLHLRKIKMSDAVVIVNTNGYVGPDTLNEIDYAQNLGKPIIYWNDGYGLNEIKSIKDQKQF